MIQVNGERYRVVMLACGYLFRLKPETNKFTNNGEVINYGQLIGLLRKIYLGDRCINSTFFAIAELTVNLSERLK